MSNQYGPKIVTNGLVLCLDAANSKSYPGSGTIWTDLSGNNKNGTLLSGPTFANTNGGVINYAGSAKVSTTLTLGTVYSLNIWFKLNALSTFSYQALLGVYQTNYMCMIVNNNTPYMGIWTETLSGNTLNSPIVSANIWYNYTLTRSGNSLSNGYKLYVNGLFTGSSNTATRVSTNYVYVGGRPDIVQTPNGGISIAHVYNRSLLASEIAQNYNATKGRFGL